ncbi:hypothetical protein [Rathayibacter iranicus]|uniref:Uncharacterized protein n=2 Tax=Rathayibacter iranicus TaxID=59737 RepID=A0AAD1EP11_9MICO|nr:hypothetical protein [Rathayibacter iranicus]AZZ57149.1 hypothetical protein C7V51_15685 [Rathayibacter iranicus]MWV29781.1 hypothetical protein [Rathayibacter iranicus NCPPB 2253 = VKM Ac-1602]PPI41391.1 hypothetical protein C5E09_14545 [Rathayibacter iranicus]PPI57419.1 hypothetical protein C5E08_15435 [Rathayibacter iranicus]PPI68286.1 hypothetical protein C5E01_14490 [Rathayibacter iranicus]
MPSVDAGRQSDGGFEEKVFDFVLEIMEMLAKIIPNGLVGLESSVVRTRGGGVAVTVEATEELGLRLDIDDRETFRLIVQYRLVLSPVSHLVSVERSTFKVNVVGSARPLFTVDYLRESGSDIPAAHYNVHAERQDMTDALAATGARRRGKIHQKRRAKGDTPRFGDVHFPTGGHRFRPCLEDVLEMMMIEFGIDILDGAGAALHQGRLRWRKRQLAAAVSDDPMTAAAELERLGFDVNPRNGATMPPRLDRLTAL